MSVENGEWVMKGVSSRHPECIHTIEELEEYIEKIGFLPLFANGVEGFSVEEWTDPKYWWTENARRDPWVWREQISRKHKIAYGKFFDKKAGFVSLKWLPYFVNYRRDGYDFDARWEDGLANRREKKIMDYYIRTDDEGDTVYSDEEILSTELKKKAGFGKEGDKNYPGIITGLQMQFYLVTADFRRRTNKKGGEYGMAVSVMFPPEKIWGYDTITSAYKETPLQSWQRLFDHVKELYEEADDEAVIRLIGKKPLAGE